MIGNPDSKRHNHNQTQRKHAKLSYLNNTSTMLIWEGFLFGNTIKNVQCHGLTLIPINGTLIDIWPDGQLLHYGNFLKKFIENSAIFYGGFLFYKFREWKIRKALEEETKTV